MPFYKWIVGKGPDITACQKVPTSECSLDVVSVANARMVRAMRHLAQLMTIADDIFKEINDDCKSVLERTKILEIKILRCQAIVDKFNPKVVPVPVGTLTDLQLTEAHYAYCPVEHTEIDRQLPKRTPAVDRLYQSAYGPSPPAIIPSYQAITPEADGKAESSASSSSDLSYTTHIYCQPLRSGGLHVPNNKTDTGPVDPMLSSVKVPSTIVPIDISGQTFTRMSSFRRSLIHVDFLVRRKKKKDKRRNTVSEGETKELKEILQKIAITDNQLPAVPNLKDSLQRTPESNEDTKETEPKGISFNDETNNNFINENSLKKTMLLKNQANTTINSDFINEDQNNGIKIEDIEDKLLKNKANTSNSKLSIRRKPRSNIPISTVSAAMTVAVEMRQLNKNEEAQSSSGNWSCSSEQNSSDSDLHKLKPYESNDGSKSTLSNNEDFMQDEKYLRKIKLKENFSYSISENNERKLPYQNESQDENEISSYPSSENNNSSCDRKTSISSSDENNCFMSSDESDDDLSDLKFFKTKYGSSTSLSTISDGSLNSLLSRTGTEMASSTGTLTSIGLERLPTPPPPPPMILAAVPQETIKGVEPISSLEIKPNFKKSKINSKPNMSIKSPKKSIKSPQKVPKLLNSNVNTKNILGGLGTKNFDKKEIIHKKQREIKDTKKPNKSNFTPIFDMYGNRSPKNTKPIVIITQEIEPNILENETKNHLQSFCPNVKNESIDETKSGMDKESQTCNDLPKCNNRIQSHEVMPDMSVKSISIEKALPLKYIPQVTVTPLQRQSSFESKNNMINRINYKIDNYSKLPLNSECNIKTNYQQATSSGNSIVYSSPNTFTKPKRPMTLIPEKNVKPSARVVLDPEGRVIYATNSLDRRPFNNNLGKNNSIHIYKEESNDSYKKSSSCQDKHPEYKLHNQAVQLPPNKKQSHIYTSPTNHIKSDDNSRYSNNTHPKQDNYNGNNTPIISEFYPYHDVLPTRETRVKFIYNSDSEQSLNNTTNSNESDTPMIYNTPEINIYRENVNLLPPDPNISGLPPTESMLTQHNVNLHSKHMERLCSTPKENMQHSLSECSYLMPPPRKFRENGGGSLENDIHKVKHSTMSTEDLFTVIHNCKRRLNIKTDSDISLASSSRSSSPSYARSSSKNGLAETGFLSPRNSYAFNENGRDRRSWSDFRSPPAGVNERKSLASDRLGPAKPTSMHDFKMLLLQARSSSQTNGPRKSAVEMLKVPISPNKGQDINSPLNLSPRNSISFSTTNSPTSDLYLYNGHSTVPFKRGNRARTSLQQRYTMYPPIFEDESECSREPTQNVSNKQTNIIDKTNGDENPNIITNRCYKNDGCTRTWV